MPLPNSPVFEYFLESLRIERPEDLDEWAEFIAVRPEIVNEDGRIQTRGAIHLWYPKTSTLSMDGFLRKLVSELERLGHPANAEIASIILSLFTLASKRDGSRIDQFNALFQKIVSADLNQYLLFSLPSMEGFEFEIGPFKVGPFSHDRLAYQSGKAGSDFHIRYQDALSRPRLSVERESTPVKVILWQDLLSPLGAWLPLNETAGAVAFEVADRYFQLISGVYLNQFLDELAAAQEIPRALGSGWFDPRELNAISGRSLISIYLNFPGKWPGFVCPALLAPTLNLGGAHLGIPATRRVLRDCFDFQAPTESEIHQSLRSYCHFLALAESHHQAGRHAEGFLHHVIALDLLLGDKLSTTQAVTRRSAVLHHRPRGKKFPEAVQESKDLYDARSKYVHEGRLPSDVVWDITRSICREVAFCLLRLQRVEEKRTGPFRDQWLREIDLVEATINAGREPATADLENIGVGLEDNLGPKDLELILQSPEMNGPKLREDSE